MAVSELRRRDPEPRRNPLPTRGGQKVAQSAALPRDGHVAVPKRGSRGKDAGASLGHRAGLSRRSFLSEGGFGAFGVRRYAPLLDVLPAAPRR